MFYRNCPCSFSLNFMSFHYSLTVRRSIIFNFAPVAAALYAIVLTLSTLQHYSSLYCVFSLFLTFCLLVLHWGCCRRYFFSPLGWFSHPKTFTCTLLNIFRYHTVFIAGHGTLVFNLVARLSISFFSASGLQSVPVESDTTFVIIVL